jgi:hypothetical protein
VAEQPQPWADQTLKVTPQDPWADPPTPGAAPPAGPNPFQRGVAPVGSAAPRTEPFTAVHEPTRTGWPGGEPRQRRPVGWHLSRLRRGGEWSNAAVLFAFVCWGIWAISSDGDLTTPLLVFAVSLLVAVGLFALTRVVGRLVLEKQLGRVRHTARGAHLVAAVFMVGVGVAHLRQTQWVMDSWNWLVGLFG